jgi:hypothetical protein
MLWCLTLVLSSFEDTLRKRAWPRLVGLDFNLEPMTPLRRDDGTANKVEKTAPTVPSTPPPRFEIDTSGTDLKNSAESIPPDSLLVESMDAQQIERDVARCTWHLLTGSQRSRRVQYQNKQRSKKVATLLKKKQRRLANLINLTLVESYSSKHQTENKDQHRLRYYQGYHDVACIFMHALSGAANNSAMSNDNESSKELLCGADFELPSKVLQQISFSHLSDALQSNFLQLQTGIKLVLFPLLAKLDPVVHNHLLDADMEPFFCLSWIITWFAHDVRDTSLVKRLFDAFIVSHPLLPVYMAIAMMLHPYNRNIIMETDCDFASLHQVLASLPRHSCSVGWKKRRRESYGGFDDGGLEYISDHEDEGGDDGCGCGNHHEQFLPAPRQPGGNKSIMTASTVEMEFSASNAGSNSVQSVGADDSCSGQWVAIDSNGNFKSPATRSVNPSSATSKNPVPFQDVLDEALLYMKRYPPRCLVELAQKYYAEDWNNQLAMLNLSASSQENMTVSIQQQIGLLRPCPAFSIVPFCASDWVIKQRLGIKTSSRKNRRRKCKGNNGTAASKVLFSSDDTAVTSTSEDFDDPMEFVRFNSTNLAVIAAGYGPGIWPELVAASRRRFRRRLFVGTVVVGFLAMGGSMYFQSETFGANATRKMFARLDKFSVNDDVCEAPFTLPRLGSKPTNEEADAINKAASVILPRINVLQQGLPSPLPLNNSKPLSPNTSRSVERAEEMPRQQQTNESKNDVSSPVGREVVAAHTDVGHTSAIAQQKQRLVAFTYVAKRLMTRIFVEFILQPFKFIWRTLTKEARMYAVY